MADQSKIWDYYQNEAQHVFTGARARVRRLVRLFARGDRVLNVGIGGGHFEEASIAAGIRIYSVDPSERAVESLRERLGMGDRARGGRAQDLPFEDGSFDGVVMSEVLEHLEDGVLEKSVVEVGRVLVSGGRLAGTVPAREPLEEQRAVCPRCGERFHRWGHVRSFTADSLRELLSARFRVERMEERAFFDWERLNWKGKLGGAAKVFLRAFGVHGSNETIFFVARRPSESRV